MSFSVFRSWLRAHWTRIGVWSMSLILVACSDGTVSGPVQISLIQPVSGGHCQYQVVPTTITTLQNINTLKGMVGQVVTTSAVLDSSPDILANFAGMHTVDLDFGSSGNVYYPNDYQTLYNASVYQAVEATYKLTLSVGSQADLMVLNPNLPATHIIYDAQMAIDDTGELTTNNAAYQAYPVTQPDGTKIIRDYMYMFPDEDNEQLSLGLNEGIVAHESMHEWDRYAWKGKVDLTDTTTKNTIRSIDEGTADYAGYMVSTDTNFFDCTLSANGARDLSQRKAFTGTLASTIGTNTANYAVHSAGAVWAYAQWKIASNLGAQGAQQNLAALVQMFLNFSSCARSDGNYDFNSVIQCHIRALGSNAGAATSVYSDVFAGTFGG